MTRQPDSGSATVLMLAIVSILFIMASLLGTLGGIIIAKRQVQAAADLGALAGARHAAVGEARACQHATQVVRANGATLTACTLDGLDLCVTTTMPTLGPIKVLTVTARARAGPQRTALAVFR